MKTNKQNKRCSNLKKSFRLGWLDLKGLLRALVDSSDDAIISKTLNGIIVNWNYGAEVLYGYSEQEVEGRFVSILIPKGYPNELMQILDRISKGERIEHYETLRAKKDGTIFPVSLSVSPIKDENGNIIGASAISRDITKRKKMEDELRQRINNFENLLSASMDREKEMLHLKKQINKLSKELGREEPYKKLR